MIFVLQDDYDALYAKLQESESKLHTAEALLKIYAAKNRQRKEENIQLRIVQSVDLSPQEIARLGLISGDVKNDATFIRTAVSMLFSSDQLSNLCIFKKQKRTNLGEFTSDNNIVMDGTSKLKFKDLLTWRLRKYNVEGADFDERSSIGRLNSLLSKAIYYLKSKK